jgi:nucleoside-diphosphate kinase
MSNKERTLVLIKPDGVQRGLIGPIISKFERRGLKLVGLKMLLVDEALAKRHYGNHQDKPFFAGLLHHITSSPVVAAVFEGERAVEAVRQLMGATDPLKASPGTVRGDLGLAIGKNLVHGSDSPDTAIQEVNLFFESKELIDWDWNLADWIIEI